VTEGTEAIAQARQMIADGRVPIPDGDLITQAMWHLATEGVMPRLERLALAGALIALEIDQMLQERPEGIWDEAVRRDDAYWDEAARAVGTGTRSSLWGTSTRSLRKELERLREITEED
jgi:hypothetical protein